MLMKNGDEVPDALDVALTGDAYALTVFLRMRPSCQKQYAEHIREAKTAETAQRRATSTLAMIHKYGQQHGIEPVSD